MDMNATIIGQYFLSKNPDLTDIQIQKLVYYAYCWYMVKNNGNKLFEERPQAWKHGPVFRSLFDNMKRYDEFRDSREYEDIEPTIKAFLDIVYAVYGKFSGNELEEMTHLESPWQNARIGLDKNAHSQNFIDDKDIMECYGH